MPTGERCIGMLGSGSGSLSFLGSYNICHSICMGTLALFSMAGITLGNLPFLFLQDFAPYFWGAALLALAGTLVLYHATRHSVLKKWIWINAGFLLAGLPFRGVQEQLLWYQLTGGILVVYGLYVWKKERRK